MTPVSWHTETAGAGGSLRRALGAAAGTAAAAGGGSSSAPASPFPNSSRPISSSESSATGAASCVAASPPACCIAVPHTRVTWDCLLHTHSTPLALWLHGPPCSLTHLTKKAALDNAACYATPKSIGVVNRPCLSGICLPVTRQPGLHRQRFTPLHRYRTAYLLCHGRSSAWIIASACSLNTVYAVHRYTSLLWSPAKRAALVLANWKTSFRAYAASTVRRQDRQGRAVGRP